MFLFILKNTIQYILIVFFPHPTSPISWTPAQLHVLSFFKIITKRAHTRKYSVHFVLVNYFWTRGLTWCDIPASLHWSKLISALSAPFSSFFLKWDPGPTSLSPCPVWLCEGCAFATVSVSSYVNLQKYVLEIWFPWSCLQYLALLLILHHVQHGPMSIN